MQIKINGEQRDVPDRVNIEDLIRLVGLQNDRVAVERNRDVVSRSQWPGIVLEENDQIEIIHFVGGGTTSRDE